MVKQKRTSRKTRKSAQGRPERYTLEVVKDLKARMKKTGKTLKAVVAAVNVRRKAASQIKYVPLLVAMERLGVNLRRKKA